MASGDSSASGVGNSGGGGGGGLGMMSTSGGPPQVVPGGSVTPQKRNKSGSHPSPTPLMSAGPEQQQPTSNGQVGGPAPTLAGNQPSAIQPPGKASAVAAANNTKHQPSVTQTPASVVGQPPFQVGSITQFFNKLLRSQISKTELPIQSNVKKQIKVLLLGLKTKPKI